MTPLIRRHEHVHIPMKPDDESIDVTALYRAALYEGGAAILGDMLAIVWFNPATNRMLAHYKFGLNTTEAIKYEAVCRKAYDLIHQKLGTSTDGETVCETWEDWDG